MNYSLNEIEALAIKATRSVGYPWGIAEESARSVRWLCQNGIDGCQELTAYLEQTKPRQTDCQGIEIQALDDKNLISLSPVIDGDSWTAPGGRLCPLLSGTALSDRANSITDAGVTLHHVAQPSLLLYFAALVARQQSALNQSAHIISIQWQGCQLATDGITISAVEINESGTLDKHADEVFIKTGSKFQSVQSHFDRAAPAESVWQKLNSFASGTYAPASEESRLKGAGAGLSDND